MNMTVLETMMIIPMTVVMWDISVTKKNKVWIGNGMSMNLIIDVL
jgi:hypothetical protein